MVHMYIPIETRSEKGINTELLRANKRDIAILTNFPLTPCCLVADPTVVDFAGSSAARVVVASSENGDGRSRWLQIRRWSPLLASEGGGRGAMQLRYLKTVLPPDEGIKKVTAVAWYARAPSPRPPSASRPRVLSRRGNGTPRWNVDFSRTVPRADPSPHPPSSSHSRSLPGVPTRSAWRR